MGGHFDSSTRKSSWHQPFTYRIHCRAICPSGLFIGVLKMWKVKCRFSKDLTTCVIKLRSFSLFTAPSCIPVWETCHVDMQKGHHRTHQKQPGDLLSLSHSQQWRTSSSFARHVHVKRRVQYTSTGCLFLEMFRISMIILLLLVESAAIASSLEESYSFSERMNTTNDRLAIVHALANFILQISTMETSL